MKFSKRPIILWGAGFRGNEFLIQNPNLEIDCFCDNNRNKSGTYLYGKEIKHPSQIDKWEEVFVIITTDDCYGIHKQLKELGLKHGENYILYSECIPEQKNLEKIRYLQKKFTGKQDLIEKMVTCKEEYDDFYHENKNYLLYENEVESIFLDSYPGYCQICDAETFFEIDHKNSIQKINWRENLKCPYCGCWNRIRFLADRAFTHMGNRENNCYIYERETKVYQTLKKHLIGLVGSEYLGDSLKSGSLVEGILHEDATDMSFPDNSFDIMISFDVFEHVDDYENAFQEAFRCLKSDGKLMMTIPFNFKQKTEIYAKKLPNGEMKYYKEPEYHGNPVSEKGSLSYRIFGWDVLEKLKLAGFKNAYAIAYASAYFGYLGYLPVCFEAVK